MNKNITATILIVLAVGIYLTVTQDILDSAKIIKVKNDEYSSAIDKADQLIRIRDKVLKEFNDISEVDRQRIDKILPTSVDNIRLIIDLNSLALNDGIQLSGLKATAKEAPATNPGDPQLMAPTNGNMPGSAITIATASLDTVEVTFGTTATFSQFLKFMKDLESNLRLMDITSLNVTGAEGGMYNFGVKLKTYWLRQ